MFKSYFAHCEYRWIVDVTGAAGTLYEGERFKLQFKFGARYPFDSPEVTFFIVIFSCHYWFILSVWLLLLFIILDDQFV